MKEKKQQLEQYFFDKETVRHLADILSLFSNPCCLGAPTVALELCDRGLACSLLDKDGRWGSYPGYVRYDIHQPKRLGQRFGIILTDPPFFEVTVQELFKAIRYLSDGDEAQQLLICHLVRRREDIVKRFRRYGVSPIEYYPGYCSVANNGIRLFGNVTCSVQGLLESWNTRRLTDTPQKH